MTSSRNQILGNIRRGLQRDLLTGDALDQVRTRLREHPANTVPARSQLPQDQQIALFESMANEAAAELIELKTLEALPGTVAEFCRENGIDQLVSASDPALTALDWSGIDNLEITHRVAQAGDSASLTTSFCGIAETGTLMLLSGPHSPTTLNFLPDTHLVLLKQSQIVGAYEEAWARLRQHSDAMPRTVNMITGPSRSADIEQKLQMGAHGPKRLIILLLRD
ncbi:LutC/YkgG family protein [Motiliproteus sediminis]|uniref:LutC/YkgG family protein n=1 Tax=Motiliproteus sediminis TaxID=1468178 RepID=UPI001AEF6DFD|nr:lactate utilization protein C [Motiliproteus sediminis]